MVGSTMSLFPSVPREQNHSWGLKQILTEELVQSCTSRISSHSNNQCCSEKILIHLTLTAKPSCGDPPPDSGCCFTDWPCENFSPWDLIVSSEFCLHLCPVPIVHPKPQKERKEAQWQREEQGQMMKRKKPEEVRTAHGPPQHQIHGPHIQKKSRGICREPLYLVSVNNNIWIICRSGGLVYASLFHHAVLLLQHGNLLLR